MFENVRYLTARGLEEALAARPQRRPGVVVSASQAARAGLEDFLRRREDEGWLWLRGVDPNPTEETVQRALAAARAHGIDGLVAIGGGSAIDLAKAVSALWGLPGLEAAPAVLDAVARKAYKDNAANALPIIAVPTTAGTGSEVTQWATVWGAADGAKYSVDAPCLLPAEAWIVPELTLSLPPRLTLATGLDAVAHASEAYWSRHSNPLVQSVAVRAIESMVRWLPEALKAPGDLALRTRLSTGALLAGFAFSRTRTTACHSISYPLTAMFGVEHGFAAALTLAPVAEANAAAVNLGDLREIYAPHGGMQAWLDGVCGGLVRLRLSNWGIAEKDIPAITQNAFTAGRMDNNPVDLSPTDVEAILRQVL